MGCRALQRSGRGVARRYQPFLWHGGIGGKAATAWPRGSPWERGRPTKPTPEIQATTAGSRGSPWKPVSPLFRCGTRGSCNGLVEGLTPATEFRESIKRPGDAAKGDGIFVAEKGRRKRRNPGRSREFFPTHKQGRGPISDRQTLPRVRPLGAGISQSQRLKKRRLETPLGMARGTHGTPKKAFTPSACDPVQSGNLPSKRAFPRLETVGHLNFGTP